MSILTALRTVTVTNKEGVLGGRVVLAVPPLLLLPAPILIQICLRQILAAALTCQTQLPGPLGVIFSVAA